MAKYSSGNQICIYSEYEVLSQPGGLTQEKLSESIGMRTSYISYLEPCKRLSSAETIDKIEDILKRPVFSLFLERGLPASIKETFAKIYGTSLKDELSK